MDYSTALTPDQTNCNLRTWDSPLAAGESRKDSKQATSRFLPYSSATQTLPLSPALTMGYMPHWLPNTLKRELQPTRILVTVGVQPLGCTSLPAKGYRVDTRTSNLAANPLGWLRVRFAGARSARKVRRILCARGALSVAGSVPLFEAHAWVVRFGRRGTDAPRGERSSASQEQRLVGGLLQR